MDNVSKVPPSTAFMHLSGQDDLEEATIVLAHTMAECLAGKKEAKFCPKGDS